MVIVGASLAGITAGEALRRRGFDGPIVLIGAEPGTPDGLAFDRPALSKQVLAEPGFEPLEVTSPARLAELDIELVSGVRARSVDPGATSVVLDGGRSVRYDQLVVATGSTPRQLPGRPRCAGIHVLRTAADALALRAELVAGARVVIVGGGFVGAEVAGSAKACGCDVQIVEAGGVLMQRGLGRRLGAAMTSRLRDAGTSVRTEAPVSEVVARERVTGVRLGDGTVLPADVVVLGLGTSPDTDWLRESGLPTQDGLLCDDALRVRGSPNVLAAGDVARWSGGRWGATLRVEHWTNAVETGRHVAATIAGDVARFAPVPYVWSDLLGSRLQVFGCVGEEDHIHFVEGHEGGGPFVALAGRGDRLQAVVGFGAARSMLPYRRLLRAGANWSEALEQAGEPMLSAVPN